MPTKGLTFRELLTAAAKSVPELWTQDGELNLTAVARYCAKKGQKISQPTLHRHFEGSKHKELSQGTIDAISKVFRIPRNLLRGEPMAAEFEKLLTDYKLSTLLLAQKIELLPESVRRNILNQIEDALEREEQLKRAYSQSNITPLDKNRR